MFRAMLSVVVAGVFVCASIAGLSGCASRHSFDAAQEQQAEVLSLLGEQALSVDSSDRPRHEIDARLRYLRAVREKVVDIDDARLRFMSRSFTARDARLVEAGLITAYNHTKFMAAFPGKLDEAGAPADPATASAMAVLEGGLGE